MSSQRPLPVPDEVSTPYWDAAARHVLTVARCSPCGALALPPDVLCTACGSTDPRYVFTPVSGHGVVRSWTVVRKSFLPGFDVPFVLVDVELEEQPDLRLIGRLLGADEAALSIGTPVTAVFEDVSAEIAVPAFKLAS
ncbi:Zn-ribbon domain-containing OB-fold protein [Mycobacterium sp. 852002-51152_SCH6134967]|uniref:Zn-ribbon domain-containing OB-fold protein n=1 Tax=Mycobacterium sp. 852002-51152_SCH6134967 TaxID=1834096 RepID=UPI000A8BB565|nr:OB-fold domain-containing protein [Mycobacterium sp. 852002-51152_SCH6134967]